MRIDRLRRNFDVEVEWIHFPLHPETPKGGQKVTELFRGRDRWVEQMKHRLRLVAEDQGLALGRLEMIYNSRLAQELSKWAEAQPGAVGDAFHEAMFQAYFVDNVDIGDIDQLVGIAEGVGLPGAGAREALEERTYREAIDQDWALSLATGVTGVPTFVAGPYGVVGAQEYPTLVKLLEKAGATARDSRVTGAGG